MDEYLKYLDTDEMRLIMEVQKTMPQRGFTYIRKEKKTGRNEPCKCGSGKKYKRCCAQAILFIVYTQCCMGETFAVLMAYNVPQIRLVANLKTK